MKKRRGASKAGRKTGSTSAASKKDEAVVETSTQETQTQPTQEADETAVKVESQCTAEEKNEDEVKEDQAEKEEDEAKPDSPTHPKSENEDAKEDQEEDKEEAKEDQVVVKEEAKPDVAQGGASSSQPQLRRGKRRRSAGNEAEKKPTPRAKRARATTSKPQEAEPEYFKDKRNLEDLWKAAFPVGTEWDQQDRLYESKWDFKNVEEALEEGGMLYGKRVYVFGCTESQSVPHNNGYKTVLVPTVVCIDSSIPPFDKIGVATVQGGDEEIIPMKSMKMAWVPYIPLEKRDRPVDGINFPIFILGCTQRRSALKHLKEDRAKKFNYCLPYINNPLKEDESEQITVVQITFPSEPEIKCEYDWATDKLEEFTDDLIKKKTLLMDQKDEFIEFVEREISMSVLMDYKDELKEEEIGMSLLVDSEDDFKEEEIGIAKAANEEALDKATEGMSEETKKAYKEMKLYKFYPLPSPDTPDVAGITKSSAVNKYFGNAHQVF